ncbi:hypothetical protein ACVW00_002366 [Marmoricola sp. URHA0025 HA25]
MELPCSASSVAAGETLAGSAPTAAGWLCLEQNGPWGPKAWTSSHLDPELGAAIEAVAAANDIRPTLIRRPGRHADARVATARQVFVAHSRPGATWLLEARVDSPAEVLALDFAAVAAGDREAVIASLPSLVPAAPQLLVCTNGTRDTCCARLGRPIAVAASARFPGRVWEATHTSGHRFAPTTALLPSGSLHGRVLDAAPLLAAETAGDLEIRGYRGRSVWSGTAQVAEDHVRRELAITGLDDLDVSGADPDWLVSHRDGRRWQVSVTAYEDGERPESCGKASKPVTRYAVSLLPLPN